MATGSRYGLEVRAAAAPDAAEIARLLGAAGAAVPAAEAAARLEAVRAWPHGAVLVTAGWSGLNGVVAAHWAPTLHHHRPLATISALVVDPEERRHGIGRLLLKAAAQAARAAGCDALVMADAGKDAEAFCQATGFAAAGACFVRPLRRRHRAGGASDADADGL